MNLDLSGYYQLAATLIALIGAAVGLLSYRSRTKVERAKWTSSLIKDFLLAPRNISVRRNLELYYNETLNNYIQAVISGDDPRYCCSIEEIESARELEDFFAQLEFFCYLESRKILSRDDLDASLGFWFGFLAKPQFISLRVYLQLNSFEFLCARIGGELALNRILVYGTLRSGEDAHKEFGLDIHSESLGLRKIPGELFAVNSQYPGAHINMEALFGNFPPKNYESFECEMLEINTSLISMDEILYKLDAYENTNERNVIEYRRIVVPVDGRPAWIYNYIDETTIHPKIESGVWARGPKL